MRTLLSVPVALLVLVAIGEPAGAASRILYLRKDCTGVPDCYQDLIPAYSAIFQQRFLGSTDPYSIEVGPGEFSFSFGWSAFVGDVTIRRIGRRLDPHLPHREREVPRAFRPLDPGPLLL